MKEDELALGTQMRDGKNISNFINIVSVNGG